MKTLWAHLFLLLAIVLLSYVLRLVWNSKTEYNIAHAYALQGNDEAARLHLRRSLDWNIYNRRSAELLWAIAEKAERHGRKDVALEAYRSHRAAIYAARSFYQPKQKILRNLDDKIVSLMEGTEAEKKQWLLEMIQPSRPGIFWAPMSSLLFVVWIASTFVFIAKGFDSSGKMSLKRGPLVPRWVVYFVTFLCSLGLWILCLMKVG